MSYPNDIHREDVLLAIDMMLSELHEYEENFGVGDLAFRDHPDHKHVYGLRKQIIDWCRSQHRDYRKANAEQHWAEMGFDLQADWDGNPTSGRADEIWVDDEQ